jgi:cation transport ATPase
MGAAAGTWEGPMDISTFYALFSATCFTLLGLWWNVVQNNPEWTAVVEERRAVGGVYLTFLLPAMMGLFAQVGGVETPVIWRVSFVAVAIIGCVSTLRILRVLRHDDAQAPRAKYVATLGIYVLIAVTGAYPEIASPLDIKPVQAEALLLILLVLVGHGLVWDFMIRAQHRAGEHVRGFDE